MRVGVAAVVLAIVLSLAGLSAATHCTAPIAAPFPGDEPPQGLMAEPPVAPDGALDTTVMY